MLIKKNKNILIFFLGLYIFSLCFHKLIIFNLSIGMNPKLSELTFIPLFLICIFYFYNTKFKISFYDLLLITLLFLPLLSFFFVDNYKIIQEIFLSSYFLSIFFVFRLLISNGYFRDLINLLKTFSIFVAFFSIFGWFAYQIYNFDYFVLNYEYPLKILKSARAKSFFEHPNAMVNFLVFPFLLFFFDYIKKKQKRDLYGLIVLFFGIFLAFSKSFVVILLVLNFYLYLTKKDYKIIYLLITLLIFSIYIVFSHIIIIDKKSDNYKYYTSSKFLSPSNKPLFKYKEKEIYLNNYYEMKLKSLEYWKQNKILGNGSFNYQNFKSRNASYMSTNDHHSTYFYILASKGLIGFTIFIIFTLYSFSILKSSKNIRFICILFLLYLLIEGINTNLLTTRTTWIVFAIIGSIKTNYENHRYYFNL